MIRLSVHLCLSILLFQFFIFSHPIKNLCENGLNRNSCIRTLDYTDHLDHLDEFQCGSPIPHFFPADKIDELKSHLLMHHLTRTDLDPHGTILHRCRNCGYCTNMFEKCTHVTSEIVNLEFQAFKSNLRFQIQLVNHTSCRCVNIKVPQSINRTNHNRKRHRRKKRKRLRQPKMAFQSNS